MTQRWRRHVERVLRAAADTSGSRFRDAAAAVVWGGALYGAVMGAFGGVTPDRWLQIVYSAVKVPFLIMAIMLLTLPSYFVFNTLAGLRSDFPAAIRAVAITQGTVGIVLASLAPFTALWYLTSADYDEARTFNGGMFAIATFAAQRVLRRHYQPLIARNRRHRILLWVWVVLYVFVGIQMAWTLRPFVSNAEQPPTFFRHEAMGNAYVSVSEIVWRAFTK